MKLILVSFRREKVFFSIFMLKNLKMCKSLIGSQRKQMHVMIVKWKKLKFDELLDELFFCAGSSGKFLTVHV